MTTSEFELLNKRRKAIELERARLRESFAKIEAERKRLLAEEEELTRVEQALLRWASRSEPVLGAALPESESPIPRKGPPRPKGIPTTREMIDQVLMSAERRGEEGLSGRDLVRAISERWWAGCGWNDVLPTALLLVKKKQLGRNPKNKLFVRLRKPDAILFESAAHAAE
jgi:hypothetical protein